MSEIQVTLRSNFDDQSGYVKVEYDFTEGVKYKRCSYCRRKKKLSDFGDNIRSKDGKLSTCKKCHMKHIDDLKCYYIRHREKIKRRSYEQRQDPKYVYSMREWRFLYMAQPHTGGFLWGTGFCILCDYDDPLGLENHHVVPHIDGEEDFIISLCGGCHKKYNAGSNQERHMKNVQNAIEKSKRIWKEKQK